MYATVPAVPVHIASAWGEYSYPKYIGGALSLSSLIMERCNGYPNSFWGWGGEDDDMHARLERTGFGLEYRMKAPIELRGTMLDMEAKLLSERGGVRAGTSLKNGGEERFRNMLKREQREWTSRDGNWTRDGLSNLQGTWHRVGARSLNKDVTVVTVDLMASECHPEAARMMEKIPRSVPQTGNGS